MKNNEVAELLDRLGELVEANGEDRFKVIAYHRAATSIRNLDEDVEKVWREGRVEEIKYVGEGIARKIDEYLSTGKLALLERLNQRTPPGGAAADEGAGCGAKDRLPPFA